MQPNRWVIVLIITLFSHISLASIRISGGYGFGVSSSKQEIVDSEGPLTQAYTLEYLIHTRLLIGAEHIRSFNLSPISTAISFTGLFARYYLNNSCSGYQNANSMGSNALILRDICYFVGGGFGFAQSNLLPDQNNKSSNASGLYLSPQFGAEFALTERFGLRGEVLTGFTVMGSGSINTVSLMGSLYYVF